MPHREIQGQIIGPYRIIRSFGGMGEVYFAEDTRLKRPNIATIHTLEEFDGVMLIRMEHVEGVSI